MKSYMDHYETILFNKVRINDTFWSERQKVNAEKSILKQYDQCEQTGRFEVLLLKWKKGDPHEPHKFWDSDAAKWLEAACFIYNTTKNEELYRKINRVADLLIGAQQPDGYLNSYFTVVEPQNRWKNLRDNHELYCAGHIFEAAVAHYNATGEKKLLDCACRFADYIDSVFGLGEGKIQGYCGHEEIELSLVKLYHATKNRRYLDLAVYFINQRGTGKWPHRCFELEHPDAITWKYGAEHYQADGPVREIKEAKGHAVRAVYLYSAMADLAREMGDESLKEVCEKIWRNIVDCKMYVTAGIGSVKHGEGFGANYQLPNEEAYCETCASVGLVMWAQRMLQIELNSEYADIIERAIYNGALSGMSLDGNKFFYENPLASVGGHHRRDWYECSCCPSNISRLIASLGSYIYTTKDDTLFVHQYMGGSSEFELSPRIKGIIHQEGDFAWNGTIRLTVDVEHPQEWKLALRIPYWAREVSLQINRQDIVSPKINGGYAIVDRKWTKGDFVELKIPMEIQKIVSHPKVAGNAGMVALQRGPFVYCVEDADFNGVSVHEIHLLSQNKLEARMKEILGVPYMSIEGKCATYRREDLASLYCAEIKREEKEIPFQAIPYFLWDNRSSGGMRVWIPLR